MKDGGIYEDIGCIFQRGSWTYKKSCGGTGKKVHVFATSGGSGIGKTAEKLAPYLKGVESVDAKLVHSAEEL